MPSFNTPGKVYFPFNLILPSGDEMKRQCWLHLHESLNESAAQLETAATAVFLHRVMICTFYYNQECMYCLHCFVLALWFLFFSSQRLWWMDQRNCFLDNDWHNSFCNISCFLQFIVGRIYFKVTVKQHLESIFPL